MKETRLSRKKRKIALSLSALRQRQPLLVAKQCKGLLIDRKRHIIMDWTPKAGCTVAIKTFFRHMGLLDEALSYHSWIHRYRRDIFYSKSYATLNDLCNKDVTLFKITRNPYTRVISSYISSHRFFKGNTKAAMQRFLPITDINTLTFAQFLDYLEQDNLHTCNEHFRQQKKLYEINQLRQPIICKLESLAQDLAHLNQQHQFNFDASGISSHHHISPQETNAHFCANTPLGDILESTPPYHHFYNAEIKKRVETIYKEDIDSYGYDFPWTLSDLS